jgi:hypothetical protein
MLYSNPTCKAWLELNPALYSPGLTEPDEDLPRRRNRRLGKESHKDSLRNRSPTIPAQDLAPFGVS